MGLRRLDLRGLDGRHHLQEALARPEQDPEAVSTSVQAVLDDVRREGDDAVRRLTARYDGVHVDELRVEPAEVDAALGRIPADLRAALEVAHGRILAYHRHES